MQSDDDIRPWLQVLHELLVLGCSVGGAAIKLC